MENQPEIPIHSLIERFIEFNQNYLRLEKQLLAKYKITKSGFSIMSVINDEKISLNELSDQSDLDKSTLSRQVKNLEKKGFITKEPGTDKRYMYLSLTTESRKLILAYSFEFEKSYSLILKSWPADEKQLLLVLMGRVNRSIQSFQVVE
ncbi:MarR family winged helix-turn-helix transcriptional regulator [Carnobacterium pleistocenium]|uniref:MarR family winged helix-turn-helix transcriptional regulator n=1 Tax=Carnobacterium pleistocenium TaxID=181073 RepID=UPI0005529C2D|nr:MarR family transcriptional regulator [Carnobacterium pleistocenium]